VIFVEIARSVFEKYVTNSFGKKRRKGFKNGISVFSGSLSPTIRSRVSMIGNDQSRKTPLSSNLGYLTGIKQ
jgi:hypothetical protein